MTSGKNSCIQFMLLDWFDAVPRQLASRISYTNNGKLIFTFYTVCLDYSVARYQLSFNVVLLICPLSILRTSVENSYLLYSLCL